MFLRCSFILSLVIAITACGPFYEENKYGNGHYMSQDEKNEMLNAQGEPYIDYQAYQYNFVSISVSHVSYKMTSTLSVMNVSGFCTNPGFQTNYIYYTVFDSEDSSLAHDGLPYATNVNYYSGTKKLQASNIVCMSNGTWATSIPIPTFILKKLVQGTILFSMVVWHKGQELHNTETGIAGVGINPPQDNTDEFDSTTDNSNLNGTFF